MACVTFHHRPQLRPLEHFVGHGFPGQNSDSWGLLLETLINSRMFRRFFFISCFVTGYHLPGFKWESINGDFFDFAVIVRYCNTTLKYVEHV